MWGLSVSLRAVARVRLTRPPPEAESSGTQAQGGGGGQEAQGRGQPGHTRHARTPFAAERVDQAYEYDCADAGDAWQPRDDYRVQAIARHPAGHPVPRLA